MRREFVRSQGYNGTGNWHLQLALAMGYKGTGTITGNGIWDIKDTGTGTGTCNKAKCVGGTNLSEFPYSFGSRLCMYLISTPSACRPRCICVCSASLPTFLFLASTYLNYGFVHRAVLEYSTRGCGAECAKLMYR